MVFSVLFFFLIFFIFFFVQAEDAIRDLVRSRGLGDVYKRQELYNAIDHRSIRQQAVVTETARCVKGRVRRSVQQRDTVREWNLGVVFIMDQERGAPRRSQHLDDRCLVPVEAAVVALRHHSLHAFDHVLRQPGVVPEGVAKPFAMIECADQDVAIRGHTPIARSQQGHGSAERVSQDRVQASCERGNGVHGAGELDQIGGSAL